MTASTSAGTTHDHALLAAIADYFVAHGITDFSYRTLAAALDVSTFKIVYHFGSKAQLIDTALRHVSRLQIIEVQSWMASTAQQPLSVGGILRRYWAWCLHPQRQAVMRLFLEAATLAMRDPEAYPPVIRDILQEGIDFECQLVAAHGSSAADSVTIATLVSGAVWGLQLDQLTTGDSERTTAAIDRLATFIDHQLAQHSTRAPTQGTILRLETA